ncbi:TraB/GumN family protein [Kiloniella litopenaei]|uniref:TraB/GumN family protein n=1 Tax=Kiloniella litopenaei TaxID=1549748 RepID=UPI00069785FE|nr:TraB/GumN family protein [Kiloniella litopenaei]
MGIIHATKNTTKAFFRTYLLVTGLVTGLIAGLGFTTQSALADGKIDPALWKLTDEDSVVWLFGTVHAQDPDLQWRTEKIKQAFASADSFYMEAPVADATPETMVPLLQKYAFNTSGTPFYEQLTPDDRANFVRALNSLGIPEEAMKNFDNLRPWFTAVTLAGVQMQAEGLNPEAGVDKALWEEAKAAGKELGYLETLEQQLRIFGNMTPQEDMAMFNSSMVQMVEDTDMLDQLFTYWKTGQIEKLATLMNASFDGQDRIKTALLDDRNADWSEKIEDIMRGSGTVFIAVGAGHLGGDQSLQWYLERLGYEVVRQ